jgi:hypothetical protein
MEAQKEWHEIIRHAKEVLKKGDRIRITHCPGTKRTITFDHWDGNWIVSKSGKNDYAATNIDLLNGEAVTFKTASNKSL